MSDPSTEGLRKAFMGAPSTAASGAIGPADAVSVLTFRLSGEWYGLRLTDLIEVIGGVDPTPVPFTPAWLVGVIHHRGSIVPLVDLRRAFGLPVHFRRDAGRIVLMRAADSVIGLQVDEISDVVQLAPPLDAVLASMEPARAAFIEGTASLPRGLVAVLSATALAAGLRPTAPE
jgi:purine-binding chemotaxis protein CheW